MSKNLNAFILIVLAVGVYFTVTKGMIADAQAVKTVNDGYLSAIDSAKELIAARDKVRDEWNNLPQSDRARLLVMLPKSSDNIHLIVDLYQLATQHGFSLKDIKVDNVAPAVQAQAQTTVALGPNGQAAPAAPAPATLQTVKVSFGVSATYLQFIPFLQDIESSLRIMDVDHLSVKTNDTGIDDWTVDLDTYWLQTQ